MARPRTQNEAVSYYQGCLEMTPRDKRKPGRPKTTWRQTVLADLSDVKLTWGEALHVAQNRDKWRGSFVALCPSGDEED